MTASEIASAVAKFSDEEKAKFKNLVEAKTAAGLPQQDAEEVAVRQIESDAAEVKPAKKSSKAEKPEDKTGGQPNA